MAKYSLKNHPCLEYQPILFPWRYMIPNFFEVRFRCKNCTELLRYYKYSNIYHFDKYKISKLRIFHYETIGEKL